MTSISRKIWLPVVTLLLLSACAERDASATLQYATASGDTVALEQFGERLIFINYWAEWCGPCRAEIPEFNHFADTYADQVVVLGVNNDGVLGEELNRQIAALGIEFPVLTVDPRDRWQLQPAEVLPETLVIGADGKLKQKLVGPQNLESLVAMLSPSPDAYQ